MRKFVVPALSLALCLGLTAGCSSKTDAPAASTGETTAAASAESTSEAAASAETKSIDSLKIAFSPYADADTITTATEPLENLLKETLLEKGYDVKDDCVGGNANQMHISAMFNDCDIDANENETEFQASLESVMYFVSSHLSNSVQINIDEEPIDFIFNRDLLMSETEILDSLVGAGVKISQKTL